MPSSPDLHVRCRNCGHYFKFHQANSCYEKWPDGSACECRKWEPTTRLNGCYLVPPPDHVWRYEVAAERLKAERPFTVDIGCGTGYGMEILKSAGIPCIGFDLDAEAIGEALKRGLLALSGPAPMRPDTAGAAVLFDVIEHDENGMDILKAACRMAKRVLFSTVRDERKPGTEHAQKYHKLWGLSESSFAWLDPQPEWFENRKWPYILLGDWRRG